MGLILDKLTSFLNRKKLKIGFVGLQTPGKASMVCQFIQQYGPECTSQHPLHRYQNSVYKYEFGNTIFCKLDLFYNKRQTPLYQLFFQDMQGLILTIDNKDSQMVDEIKEELYIFAKNVIQHKIPLLVFVDNQDLYQEIKSNNDFSEMLELSVLPNITDFKIQNGSVKQTSMTGLSEGYEWLLSKILKTN